jgi:cytochrome c oxidase cbb3-type subunit 1
MYYFVPIMLRRPMWSHGLSLVGFWGLAFFYPLTGIHHFLYSPIPLFLQHGAVITTIAIEFIVTTVIINFFATLRGQGDKLRTNLPLRWLYTGMIFYFTTCLQCAFQTTLTFQRIIHFTDWVVGHAHLVMFGVFGFWLLGITLYLWPRLVRADGWYSDALNAWHFWLTSLGTLVMFLDLLVAGLVQGTLWRDLAPWETSLTASVPYWLLRTISGTGIIVGQFLFFYNAYKTWQWAAAPRPAPTGPAIPAPALAPSPV